MEKRIEAYKGGLIMTQKEIADRLRKIVPAQPTKKETIERAVRELIKELDPAPALEPDRLYYYWDDKTNIENKKEFAQVGKNILTGAWNHIEPVHRRWGELYDEEIGAFINTIMDSVEKNLSFDRIYRIAYRIITGEEHPE
jgi:hypothetical protein